MGNKYIIPTVAVNAVSRLPRVARQRQGLAWSWQWWLGTHSRAAFIATELRRGLSFFESRHERRQRIIKGTIFGTVTQREANGQKRSWLWMRKKTRPAPKQWKAREKALPRSTIYRSSKGGAWGLSPCYPLKCFLTGYLLHARHWLGRKTLIWEKVPPLEELTI